MRDQVEDVKSKTDIVQIIGERIELKKAGKNYKAVCPFHAEKTPSFNVSPDLQIFKCFGCNQSGDVFTFLEKYEGMEFYESLKILSERAGVELKSMNMGQKSEKEKIFETNLVLEKFFSYILMNHKVGQKPLKYLFDRGLKKDTIADFGIGYSPEKPLSFVDYFKKHNLTLADAQRAGIVFKSERGYFDRFRGRITFPLYDHRGNVCGFSGRILPWMGDNLAKYINTPETSAYYKSKILFGLNLSKNEIKKSNKAVVVEGELDMISSWQIGIKNTVAIKGSAFSSDQVKLLSRYCKTIVLALDADIAGDAATKRGIEIAQKEGFDIFVADLIGYKDPDEMANKDPEGLKKTLNSAKNIWDYLLDSVFEKIRAQNISDNLASKEIAKILESIEDSIIRAQYTNKAAEKLNIPFEAVDEQVRKSKDENEKNHTPEIAISLPVQKNRRELLEERLFQLLLHNDPERIASQRFSSLFTTNIYEKLADQYKKYMKKRKNFVIAKFDAFLPSELLSAFRDVALNDNGLNDTQAENEILMVSEEIQIIEIKNKMKELSKLMEKENLTSGNYKLKKLNDTFSKFAKKLKELEENNHKGIIR